MATSSYLSESDKSPRHVTIREDIRKYVRELDMLPSPSFVAARLLNTLMDENPDPRDVQKLLELDQATSLKLFRYANSPLSASQSPVASIPDALASRKFALNLGTIRRPCGSTP
jgi:HD-like signal output (HDOD) protein